MKTEVIADTGLSTSAAHRYEELTGGRNEQAQQAGKAAAETYFMKARQEQVPASIGGLKTAIREAITATIDPKPVRAPEPERPPVDPNLLISMNYLDLISETSAAMAFTLVCRSSTAPPTLATWSETSFKVASDFPGRVSTFQTITTAMTVKTAFV